MKALIAFGRDNANTLVFVLGALWCYDGMKGFSIPAANVVVGVVLMALGAYPYLQRKRKP